MRSIPRDTSRDVPGKNPVFPRGIPMMGGASLAFPHLKRRGDSAYVLATWILLLMIGGDVPLVLLVLQWLYAAPSSANYNHTFNLVNQPFQNMVIVVGWAIPVALQSSGAWRVVTPIFFGRSTITCLYSLTIQRCHATATSNYNRKFVRPSRCCRFLWFALAGVILRHQNQGRAAAPRRMSTNRPRSFGRDVWPARLAMAGPRCFSSRCSPSTRCDSAKMSPSS